MSFLLENISMGQNLEEKPDMRIVGGEICTDQDHKSIVSITYSDINHRCAGTLLNRNWVLTAAHCVIMDIPYIVIAGISHSRGYYDVSVSPVKLVFIHPEFNRTRLRNDIALLKLAFPIEETDYIKYVNLPNSSVDYAINSVCPQALVMGWGFTIPGHRSMSADLHCVNLPLIHPVDCFYIYLMFNISTTNVICTFSKEGKDACTGDSGGPLLCNGTQFGIVSWGIGCAKPNRPGVYTRVDSYLDFVNETLERNVAVCNCCKNYLCLLLAYSLFYL